MTGQQKQPTIERVIYWMLYFKLIRQTAKEINKRRLELWYGKDGDAPKGIIDSLILKQIVKE